MLTTISGSRLADHLLGGHMKVFAAIGLAVAILFAAWSPACAQPPEAKRNPGGISMKSVRSLNQKGGGPKLIGGQPAKSTDWPASFVSDAEIGSCTATLIGPKALLLAAHCVGNGQQAQIKVEGKSFSGTCTHAPEWKDDPSADYALCQMSEPIAEIVFETVNIDANRLKNGQSILLSGYGCVQAAAPGQTQGTGGNDGVFRIGEAKVAALPGDSGNEPNTILTRDAAMVCQGDSGGGSYLILTSRRLLLAVNSRVWFEKGESYLSSVSSIDGLAFILNWIKANKEKVCGINLKGPSCR